MSIEKYQDQNNIGCLEGSRGYKALEKLVKDLGYNRPGCELMDFFYDNSGAIGALFDWIGENFQDKLEELTGGDDEESEG